MTKQQNKIEKFNRARASIYAILAVAGVGGAALGTKYISEYLNVDDLQHNIKQTEIALASFKKELDSPEAHPEDLEYARMGYQSVSAERDEYECRLQELYRSNWFIRK